jgi:hypothetical protein
LFELWALQYCQKKKKVLQWALVTHVYNPNYSGGRDQEGDSSKPAQVDSSQDLSQKYPTQNSASGVTQVAECLPSKHEAP